MSLLLVTTSVHLAQFPAGRESAAWWVWTKATAPPVGFRQTWGQEKSEPDLWPSRNVWAAPQRESIVIPLALPPNQEKPIFSPPNVAKVFQFW